MEFLFFFHTGLHGKGSPCNIKTLKSRIFKGLTIRNPAFLTHSSPGGEKIIFMQLLLVYHNLPRLSRGIGYSFFFSHDTPFLKFYQTNEKSNLHKLKRSPYLGFSFVKRVYSFRIFPPLFLNIR